MSDDKKPVWVCKVCDKPLEAGKAICDDNDDKCKKEYWGSAYYRTGNKDDSVQSLRSKILDIRARVAKRKQEDKDFSEAAENIFSENAQTDY